jgi:DNA-binding NarL/FixJ family response regulator
MNSAVVTELPRAKHIAVLVADDDVLQRVAELTSRQPNTPLVVISALVSPEITRRIMTIPTVYAVVPKTAHPSHLRAAIEAAVQRRRLPYVQPGTARQNALTARQEEIRSLLRQGLSNKRIAGTLGISEGTVKNHITGILRILNATNRTQAAQVGLEVE